MKVFTHRQAKTMGVYAIVVVLLSQAFNSFACYQHGVMDFVTATAYFVLPPLIPAVVAWFTRNPLRTVCACVLLLPWLVLAYYTDCVAEYEGGGASMIYIAVLLGGFVSSLVGAVLGGWVLRLFGVHTVPNRVF